MCICLWSYEVLLNSELFCKDDRAMQKRSDELSIESVHRCVHDGYFSILQRILFCLVRRRHTCCPQSFDLYLERTPVKLELQPMTTMVYLSQKQLIY